MGRQRPELATSSVIVSRGQELEVPTETLGTWSDMVVPVISACTFRQAESSAIIETLRANIGADCG
jgi:hypothetical protein